MSIPQLSQELIRSYATSQSWQRGENYYQNDYVRRVVQRGNIIEAEVTGSDIRPYQVNIDFNEEKLGTMYCSCPYDYEGCCKHIVATLLTCLHKPERIEQRSSLEAILDRLNEVQTQALIQELVANKPELINDIEYFADRVTPPVVTKSTSENKIASQITVNVNSIRSQVRYILEEVSNDFEYGGYDYEWEEDPVSEKISSLIQDAQMYTQRGDTVNAITQCQALPDRDARSNR